MNVFMAVLLSALAGYLLGSIDTGIIVSKLLHQDDVRNHGSGGAGMTNMLRTFGKKSASITAAGDVLKGMLAVLIGKWLFAAFAAGHILWGAYIAQIAAVIGHWKPIFFGFKGGKGVLVGAGSLLGIHPILILPLGAVFLIGFLTTRMVSVGSISIAVGYPIATTLYSIFVLHLAAPELALSVIASAIVGGMIIYLHRSNIKRILSGTEYRFVKKDDAK